MTRGEIIWKVLLALLSGPVLSGLIMLVPFAVLTGISAVLDPSLAMYEFAPEEALLLPFLLLAILISAANVRLALVMAGHENSDRIFEVTTNRYAGDPSGAENIHGHRGRQFAEDLIRCLREKEDGAIQVGEAIGEDYGWGFWVARKGYSPLWLAVAHVGKPDGEDEEDDLDDFVLSVALEPPMTPWGRLAYKPDFELHDRLEKHLVEFLDENRITFTTEIEDWVDPEPKSQPAARF